MIRSIYFTAMGTVVGNWVQHNYQDGDADGFYDQECGFGVFTNRCNGQVG